MHHFTQESSMSFPGCLYQEVVCPIVQQFSVRVLTPKDIIKRDFLSQMRESDTLETTKKMKSSRQVFVIVKSLDGRPEGMVTERNYLSGVVAQDTDPSILRVTASTTATTNPVHTIAIETEKPGCFVFKYRQMTYHSPPTSLFKT